MEMVVQDSLLDALKSIGLNLYERKIWVALLSRGVSTAGELSALAKVPRSRTYDTLESLADKGFVIIQTSKPIKYVAVPPKEALERAKKRIMERAENSVRVLEDFKKSEVISELEKIYKKGVEVVEPHQLSGSLKGKQSVHNQLNTVLKQARKRISILATPSALKEIHEAHSSTLKKLSSKGVKVRIAVPDSKEIGSVVDSVREYAEVRKINNAPKGRFVIVDGKHVILPLTDDGVHPTQELAFWTASEHAAGVLEPMFDHIWEHPEK